MQSPRLARIAVLRALAVSLLPCSPTFAQCWTAEDQKSLASDAASASFFGFSASVSGNVSVFGAPLHDALAADQGRAYVFRHDGAGWAEEQALDASDGQAGHQFGRSVAVHGDVLVVGAHNHDGAGLGAGAAYVFRHDGNAWIEEQRLVASDAAPSDYFGLTVAVDGGEIAIGATGQDGGAPDTGAVYLFSFDGAGWVETQKIWASNGASGDGFGSAVSIRNGLLVVGAPLRDVPSTNFGGAYVYERQSSGVWTEQQGLASGDGSSADFYGVAVSTDGVRVAVASERDDDAATDAGAIYVFHDAGIGWFLEQKLTAPDGTTGDRLGRSLHLEGDHLVAGSGLEDASGAASGSAYVFRDHGSEWVVSHRIQGGDVATSDQFGQGLGLSEERLVAGAFGDSEHGPSTGAAYFFELADLGFTSNLSAPPGGALLRLDACGARPAGALLMAAIDVSGLPMFVPVLQGAVDGAGAFTRSMTVPTGLSGLSITLQTFAIVGVGQVGSSRPLTLSFP